MEPASAAGHLLQPRSRRAHSVLAGASASVSASALSQPADDWKGALARPIASVSVQRAPAPPHQQHRHSRSVHQHSHHHLHLHGGYGASRPRSNTSYGKAPAASADNYLSPDAAMEKLKRVGSRLKDTAGPLRPTETSRSYGGSASAKHEARLLRDSRLLVNIKKDRRLADARSSEIRSVYQKLSNASMSNIQKLDDIYYSILERLSSLQSTIGGLQDLAVQTRQLRTTFDEDAEHVKTHAQKRITSFGGFDKQKERIAQLEARIRDGKSRTELLTERLEIARNRVQSLEDKEAEVQASISLQFRIVWFILGGIGVIVIALILANHYLPPPRHDLLDGPLSSNYAGESGVSTSLLLRPTPAASDELDNRSDLISSLTAFVQSNIAHTNSASSSTTQAVSPNLESVIISASSKHTDSSAYTAPTTSSASNTEAEEEDPRLRLFEEL